MLGHGIKEDLPLNRVEGVLEVQLEQDVVWGRLLQPHPDLVNQALGSTEYTDANLLRLQPTGGLGLVPTNE